jgi:hypothetical protein
MKPKNRKEKLSIRVRDFMRGSQSKEGKVQARWDSGGYHKPGSAKK